jgi:hypothetical protein
MAVVARSTSGPMWWQPRVSMAAQHRLPTIRVWHRSRYIGCAPAAMVSRALG